MAPFLTPEILVLGIKERIDSLLVQADRLYLGSSTGTLYVYSYNKATDGHSSELQLVETRKNLTRRSIEQLGYLKDVNSLVVLSDASLTLFPLPSFAPPTPLVKTKTALSFATHSSVRHYLPDARNERTEFISPPSIPILVTQLLVGCRRKMVIYTWKDGEAQEVKESPTPHSARTISYLSEDTACLGYSPTEYAIFSLSAMTATDIAMPVTTSTSAATTAMGAWSGLTGYMTLGYGAKGKAELITIGESEALILKDNEGLFIGPDAKQCRPSTMIWPAPPEDIAFVKPYILSILPGGTVPTTFVELLPTSAQQPHPPPPSLIPTTVLQIRSSLSSQISQTMAFPFNITLRSPSTAQPPTTPNAAIRLMTPSPFAKSPLFFVTTPADRVAAAAEGSSIWEITMKPWAEQIDELVLEELYSDALVLLGTIDESVLPDKDQRRIKIRALNAVAQFRAGRYDDAIEGFIDLDFNPAKVIALYPEAVSGRLAVPQDEWIPLYGGPSPKPDVSTPSEMPMLDESDQKEDNQDKAASDLLDAMSATVGSTTSIRERLQKTGLGLGKFIHAAPKDDDTASISSRTKFNLHDDLSKSVEKLVPYLVDRRTKLSGALGAVNITPESQSHKIALLSETPIEELFALPNAPLSSLTPEQLLRFAQIVDTALYKSYLIVRPALLQSLCRIANWCEVSEVEEDLRRRQKFLELKDLYHGKKMHTEALSLLKELSENESDMEEKLRPSISYLQKLGPEYLHQIFELSRWIFEKDPVIAFDIFTSEDVELPRPQVADYLEDIDPKICIRYLEYSIEEKKEESIVFHDRLASLYLNMTQLAKKRNDEALHAEMYTKLLKFLEHDDIYSIDRLYGQVSSTDLYEARAVLLGRLGRHDQALELYVYRLGDYMKAEEYCKSVYQPGTETSSVFLTLLRVYLRPSVQTTANLLQPALGLISRHNPRLDPVETLQLLPPLVTAHDIRAFLIEALRVPMFDTQVIRHISKARNDQVARKLMTLQSRRVKVTDSRICPQCHKRIGNSVIAVHTPRGEVTHYQCRELFARRINST